MTPTFRIVADGAYITALINECNGGKQGKAKAKGKPPKAPLKIVQL